MPQYAAGQGADRRETGSSQKRDDLFRYACQLDWLVADRPQVNAVTAGFGVGTEKLGTMFGCPNADLCLETL